MKVLVGCEESQRVTLAFRELGHLAYSCDVKPCTGGYPEFHLQGDVRNYLLDSYDLLIAFPPCTYFSRMNFLNYYRKGRFNFNRFANSMPFLRLFLDLYYCDIPRIALENPVPIDLFTALLPKPTMYLQPYEFGEPFSKKTCLWLKNLPPLLPTGLSLEHTSFISVNDSCKKFHTIEEQSTFRSKTFSGVAKAMAFQWGSL